MDIYFKDLKKKTIVFYIVIAFAISIVLAYYYFGGMGRTGAGWGISMFFFISVALFSICIPILIRLGYWQKRQKYKGLTKIDFYKMKDLSLYAVWIGSVLAVASCIFLIYKTFLYISVLMALYGIYSIWPSKKIFKMEIKSFGVKEND
jgi:Na+-driven multidrug efflux pump